LIFFKCDAGKGWKKSIKEEMHRVKKERDILRTVQRRKANWICHILRSNLLLHYVIEGNVDGSRRRERRPKELQEDLK